MPTPPCNEAKTFQTESDWVEEFNCAIWTQMGNIERVLDRLWWVITYSPLSEYFLAPLSMSYSNSELTNSIILWRYTQTIFHSFFQGQIGTHVQKCVKLQVYWPYGPCLYSSTAGSKAQLAQNLVKMLQIRHNMNVGHCFLLFWPFVSHSLASMVPIYAILQNMTFHTLTGYEHISTKVLSLQCSVDGKYDMESFGRCLTHQGTVNDLNLHVNKPLSEWQSYGDISGDFHAHYNHTYPDNALKVEIYQNSPMDSRKCAI